MQLLVGEQRRSLEPGPAEEQVEAERTSRAMAALKRRKLENAIRNEIRKFAVENNLEFFNPRNHEGLLRTLMIRTSSTGEIEAKSGVGKAIS